MIGVHFLKISVLWDVTLSKLTNTCIYQSVAVPYFAAVFRFK